MTGVFYFSVNYANDRRAILVRGRVIGYIRCELFPLLGLEEALSKAEPRSDEAVMNSHEVKVQ